MPERFNQIDERLRQYLDNESYKKTRGYKFKNLNYIELYPYKHTQKGLREGWLKVNPELTGFWKKRFGGDEKLIGI